MSKVLKRIKLFLILLILFTAYYSFKIETNMLLLNEVDLNLGYNIVLFSDTHFHKYYDYTNIDKIVDKINEQQPDLVLFAGDFYDVFKNFDGDTNYLRDALKSINSKYGKFAIWGNHDYGGGAHKEYPSLMEDGGFILLKNESYFLEELNLNLIGFDDNIFGDPDLKLLDNLNADNINIALIHEPIIADEIKNTNLNYLFAGHSHGGQIKLPIITQLLIDEINIKYMKGFYNIDNNNVDTKLFVTSGIGTTKIPFRFMSFPEIVLFK